MSGIGLKEYLVVHGRARIEEGGGPELLQRPGPHLPRARREVPADGRPAAGRRRAHRRGAPGRRRPLGLTRLGVLGWPVAHSRSPAMHNAALRAVGLTDWRYQRLPSRPSSSPRRCAPCRASASPARTSPSRTRRRRSRWPTRPPRRARAIGAANTLTFAPGGAVAADNTDAPGLLAALGDLRPRSALILGAGGSARAAAYALAQAGAAVAVWNRTPERARALAADLGVQAVAAPVRRRNARQLHLGGAHRSVEHVQGICL